jgi:integrase
MRKSPVTMRASLYFSSAGSLDRMSFRSVPDELFNRLFAELGSHRDRALVAFWVSTGARASELLGARCGDVDPGQQLVSVVRKGSRDSSPAGVSGRVRVAAALSGDGRRGASRGGRSAVVDAAPPAPAVDLSRRPGDVRPGGRGPWRELVAARFTTHCCLSNGT